MTVNLNGTDYELPEITQEITDKYPYYYIVKADLHAIMTA